MLLGACEVLQDCAVRSVLHDSEVHLNCIMHYNAGLCGTAGQHLLHSRHARKGRHDLLRMAGCGQDIDVSHSLLCPAKAASSSDVLQALLAVQECDDLVYHRLG